jgi:hypothetical protein
MDIETADLQKIIVHFVGSKNNLDQVILSEEEYFPGDEEKLILEDGFLNRFRNIGETYAFHHTEAIHFNEVYAFCLDVFNDADRFLQSSHAIARQLYEASVHPRVKGGELYVVYFEGLPVENRMCQAIGIFKSESKGFFLDVQKKKQQVKLQVREGVEMTKIDKGCLVINRNKETGFDVLVFDAQSRGEEAQYWKEKFLNLRPRQNEFHHTQHLLTLTRQFITNELDAEALPKTEQVELLNRSLDYFKSRDAFDIDEFQNEVFGDEAMIGSFRAYGSRYTDANDYDIASGFEISNEAVKKQSRIFKGIVKLDKNFHIYIHGRTDLIEKGVEADGRKFYKIYYQDEG